MDNQNKHLELITRAINRMAGNSALMKGWSVTLVVGLFVLSDKDTQYKFIYVAFVPIIFFWFLDIMYLSLERAFRNLYDKVRNTREEDIDFDMNVKPYLTFSNWKGAFSSWSTWLFHLPLLMVVIILIFILTNT